LLLPLQDEQHLEKFNDCTPTDQLPGILQLGMNRSCVAMASAMVDMLQEWYQEQQDASGDEGATDDNMVDFFTASTQRRLLVTAATRQHTQALHTMMTMPEIMQHVDVATLYTVLKQLVAAGFGSTMKLLLESLSPTKSLQETAVQQLTSEAVLQLLQAAVEHGSRTCAEPLCGLPAAKQLSAEALVQLLQAAVGQNSSACTQLLYNLPATNQVPAVELVQLLQAAVVHAMAGSRNCAALLCQLPAAQHLQAEVMVQLLQAATAQGGGGCAEPLCKLPAAQKLPVEGLVQLLQAAVAQGGGSCASLPLLCKLPAAQKITGDALAQLLLSAADMPWWQQLLGGCRMHLSASHPTGSAAADNWGHWAAVACSNQAQRVICLSVTM
jgi:hypothetical protein